MINIFICTEIQRWFFGKILVPNIQTIIHIANNLDLLQKLTGVIIFYFLNRGPLGRFRAWVTYEFQVHGVLQKAFSNGKQPCQQIDIPTFAFSPPSW